MPLPILAKVLDLVATENDAVDISSGVGPAIYQGDSYEIEMQILDENGDPFSLGATLSPDWEIAAQLRSDYADYADGVPLLEFTGTVEDGPNGLVRISATPTLTAELVDISGRWDVQLVNLSDGNYAVGYTQTVIRGQWKLLQEVTRE